MYDGNLCAHVNISLRHLTELLVGVNKQKFTSGCQNVELDYGKQRGQETGLDCDQQIESNH